jgi:4'-phosphopantetheinyl transferase
MWLSVVRAPAPRPGLLTRTERAEVARLRYSGRRRDEWIAGRLAARRALALRLGAGARDVSVVADPAGAPRVTGGGAPMAISLSHDGGRVAVALAPGRGRVAVDVCDRANARRLPAILARLGVTDAHADDACAVWAALECALKLRGLGVTALLGAPLAIAATGAGRLRVSGLGAAAVCQVASRGSYALAWAEEPA